MNFLAHILLSGSRSDMQIGGFLGDFVKGPLRGEFPPEIEAGIQLHRSIDAHTDSLPALQALRALLPLEWRRYNGILSDVLYDHFLARHTTVIPILLAGVADVLAPRHHDGAVHQCPHPRPVGQQFTLACRRCLRPVALA